MRAPEGVSRVLVVSMTLTEFLLARIAEDEAVARKHVANWTDERGADGVDQLRGLRADTEYRWMDIGAGRVLAECEAKRLIVAYRTELDIGIRSMALSDPAQAEGLRMTRFGLDQAMQLLALPYADHPDYDEAWRP